MTLVFLQFSTVRIITNYDNEWLQSAEAALLQIRQPSNAIHDSAIVCALVFCLSVFIRMAVPPILWNRFCWLEEKMVGWDRRRKTLSIPRPLLALTSMSETSFSKLLSQMMCYKSGRCPIFGCLLSFRQFVQTSQSHLMIVHFSPISRWHPPVIQTSLSWLSVFQVFQLLVNTVGQTSRSALKILARFLSFVLKYPSQISGCQGTLVQNPEPIL